MRWPVDIIKVTSEYGDRVIYGAKDFHTGMDFAGKLNTPIRSYANGVVRHVGDNPSGYGKYVVVEHPHLKNCSMYAHLEKIETKIGVKVNAGDVIGLMGTTGRSTGVHLHFEVRPVAYSKFWERAKYYGRVKGKHHVDPRTVIKNA